MRFSAPSSAQGRRPMGAAALAIWGAVALAALCGFVALGNWQVERRAWKLDLIQRVQQRIHAPAVPAPGRPEWPAIAADPARYEYRRIQASGVFQHSRTALVQAFTVLGGGYWVMTPLRMADGATLLVNRGFVPHAQAGGAWRTAPEGPVAVTGLLRLSEPGGGFLRRNAPAADRWHSRDVAQIAASRGLRDVAPYFLDAQARAPLPPALTLEPPERLPASMLPVGGLTVVSFRNTHLAYALTWYGLALMVAGAAGYLAREEARLRRARKRLTLENHEYRDDDASV